MLQIIFPYLKKCFSSFNTFINTCLANDLSILMILLDSFKTNLMKPSLGYKYIFMAIDHLLIWSTLCWAQDIKTSVYWEATQLFLFFLVYLLFFFAFDNKFRNRTCFSALSNHCNNQEPTLHSSMSFSKLLHFIFHIHNICYCAFLFYSFHSMFYWVQ